MITSVGVGGIFAILIIREVFGFLKSRRGSDSDRQAKIMEALARQTKDLWDWHNVADTDGVKVWYVRRSSEEAIIKLTTAIENMNVIFHDLARDIRDVKSLVKKG